jgi:hypothetical protein
VIIIAEALPLVFPNTFGCATTINQIRGAATA